MVAQPRLPVALLDSVVVVDLLRGYLPAQAWFTQQATLDVILGVTPTVWLEILQGAANRQAQRRAIKLLKAFAQIEQTSADFEWAIQQATRLVLSHQVSALDCLIASASYRLQLPLYTNNLKHFTPLLGPLAQKPY